MKKEKIVSTILDILYPRRCPLCGEILSKKNLTVCEFCRQSVNLVSEPFCMKCGKPIRNREQEYCQDCESHAHSFLEGRAAFPYTGKIQKSILNLKLHNCRSYGQFFSGAMAAVFKHYEIRWQIDIICPIPLHRRKRKFRGFNQAELLAKPIGEAFSIPVIPDLLVKTEETRDQKNLDRKTRQKNLKKAFKIGPHDVKLKRILLVDDIYTTGSTIDAAASVLKEAGASEVFFLTACIGTEKDEGETFQ